MKKLALTKGKFTLVDNMDFELVKKYKWYLHSRGYASRSTIENGEKKEILMHRFIMNTPCDLVTDHINGDKLDNRRKNLRICTQSQNVANRKKQKSAVHSKHKGVCKHQDKWIVWVKGKYCGLFTNELDAARAYDEQAKKAFKQFSNTNNLC